MLSHRKEYQLGNIAKRVHQFNLYGERRKREGRKWNKERGKKKKGEKRKRRVEEHSKREKRKKR